MAITNAFNLIDIMDGLASGVGAIAALILVVVNYRSGRELIVPLSIALAGSLLGFLRYNFRPAKIYLGDAGSLFIGLMLAALSMNGAYTRESLLGAVAPILILGVPVFDMLLVMYLRFCRGLPIMQGSRITCASSAEMAPKRRTNSDCELRGCRRPGDHRSIDDSNQYDGSACDALAHPLVCVSIAYALKKVDMAL